MDWEIVQWEKAKDKTNGCRAEQDKTQTTKEKLFTNLDIIAWVARRRRSKPPPGFVLSVPVMAARSLGTRGAARGVEGRRSSWRNQV